MYFDYNFIGCVSVLSILVIFGLYGIWALFRRPSRPNVTKLTTYETGEAPTGESWSQVNIRFYIIAVFYLLFDVDLIFLYPWATCFRMLMVGDQDYTAFDPLRGAALGEMLFFLFFLYCGWLYIVRKNCLRWV